MIPLSPGIKLPNQSVIDQWQSIDQLPIVGTSPRNVPMSTMIDFPSTTVEIYGGDNLNNLKRINDSIKLLEKDILIIYQLRSRTTGLKEEIDGKIPYERYSSNVIQMLNDFQKIYLDLNNHSTTAVSLIIQIFSQNKLWNEGFYYREILDQLCFLIFKLFSLLYLYSEKASIVKDIEVLISLLDGHDDNKECIQYILDTQKQLGSINSFKNGIIQQLIDKSIEPQQINEIFNILWKHVETVLGEHSYVLADNETAYIISLLFMVDVHRKFSEHEHQLKPNEKESNLILNNLPENVYSFLHEYRENHPYLVLIFELSVAFDQCCTQYNFAEKEDPLKKKNKLEKIFSPLISLTFKKLEKKESSGLTELRNDLFVMFQLFSQSSSTIFTKITNENNSSPNEKIPKSDVESFLLDLVRVLQNSNFAIHSIREFITLKYKLVQTKNSHNENENNNENANSNENENNNENTNNNENENNNENANNNENTNANTNRNENLLSATNSIENPSCTEEIVAQNKDKNDIPRSYFEIAMNDEIQDDERDNIMKILTICRLFRELIASNYSSIFSLLSTFILNEIDEFIETSFANISEHSKPVCEIIKDDIDQILELTGASLPSNSKEIFLIKLLRAKIQQFINPESKGRMTGKGNIFTKGTTLTNEDTGLLKKFLKKSLYYNDILQLEQTLAIVFDQSSLYFKETFLDSYRSYYLQTMPKENVPKNKAIYFPLTSSLPFMLINMAIKRADSHGELVGTMFYPFSIYDDAANIALSTLESKFLYDEILAECSRTLLLISWSFSHYAFKTVKTYITERYVDERLQSMDKAPIYNKTTSVNKNSIMRIRNFLQQNQLFIVGHHTNLRSNIAKLLEKIFIKEIASYQKVLENYGISSIFIFSSMMKIYRKVYTFFVECDAPLTTFDELLQIGLGEGAPNSFSSKILNSISESLFGSIIPNYSLYTNPYRLFSQINDNKISAYLRSNKNTIPFSILGQTIDGIGIKHFLEVLFYIDDGGMYKILLKMKETVKTTFNSFLEIYRQEKINIHRIKDSPLGLGSNNTFSNYEKIYGLLVKNRKIDSLFLLLRALGNIIAIAEMIDDAYALKSLSEEQFLAYIFMCRSVEENPEKIKSTEIDETKDEIFTMFGKQASDFKEMFKWQQTEENQGKKLVVAPKNDEILHPFKQVILKELVNCIKFDALPNFVETSQNLLDFPSLTGFAAVWSVLEFVYCLKECYHNNYFQAELTKVSPLAKYGESVLIAAAIILTVTNQIQMSRVFSIGEQIYRQNCVENTSKSNIVSTFLTMYDFMKSSTNCILCTLKPAIESLDKQKTE